MSPLVALIAALIALNAHRRAHRPPAIVPGTPLREFVVAALATWALVRLGGWVALAALRLPLSLAAVITGLIGWNAMMTLFAVGWRRRDIVPRLGWLVAPLIGLARVSASGLVPFSLVAGTMAWRWKETLPTVRRFTWGLAALALAIVLLWVRPLPQVPLTSLTGFTRSARLAGLTFVWVFGGHTLFGAFALFAAWVKDPSLGIRAVNRRLALSHVLVGLVPLLLLGGLWVSTTYLGVLNERAIVGTRVLDEQGRGLERSLAFALADPAQVTARLRDVALASRDAGTRVWWRHDGRNEPLSGAASRDEDHLGAWLDSLSVPQRVTSVRLPRAGTLRLPQPSLPRSGVLRLGDSLFLAAAVRDPGDSTRGAVLAVPLTPVLAAIGDSVARARLEVWNMALIQQGSASFSGDDERADSAAIDSLRRILRGGGRTPAARRAAAARALGVIGGTRAESVSAARNRLRSSVIADGDTMGLPKTGGAFLLQGHSLALGLHWMRGGWRRTRYMLTASADPWSVTSGLVRDVRTDPLGVLPLFVVGVFTLLALVVLAWDLMMVTGMGRSIAEAVAALRGAATRFGAGDLTHRIQLGGDDDLWQVAGAFNQAAAELERARAAEAERQRFEAELDVARRIQTRLLPSEPPRVEGLEVAGHYDPAREVGGDYYDHIALDAHRVLLVIADVSGKSVPAALIMSGFRAALVSQDLEHADLSPLAERLNLFLNSSLDPGKFVTAFLAVLDGRDGTLHYVNAGHNPPVLLRAGGAHESLEAGGTILGILPMSRYEHGVTRLEPGDLLVLYTDGVTEAARADSEQWGEERLVTAVSARRQESCAAIAAGVASAVREFEGDAGATDDVTLVVARRLQRL